MSLDDAVRAAKARQKTQARMEQAHRDQKAKEEGELRALQLEAAQRLSSSADRSEKFLMVSPVLLFGGYTSENKSYRVNHSERCWVLSKGESRRLPGSEAVPSCVLLLESGVMGRFYREADFHPQRDGEFVTSSRLVQLGPNDVFWGGSRTSRVEGLKRALGTAIVAYGAA